MAFPSELVLENPNGQNPKWTPFWQKNGHVDFLLLGRLIKRFAKPLITLFLGCV
jgi:hypothetical protein